MSRREQNDDFQREYLGDKESGKGERRWFVEED